MPTAVYYIRLLKLPPNEILTNQPFTIVWTITNDLGEVQFPEPTTVECHLEGESYFMIEKKPPSKTVNLEYHPFKNGGVTRSTLTVIGPVDTRLQIRLACASMCSTLQKRDVWLLARQHASAKMWIIPVWSQSIAIAKKPASHTSHEYERRVVVTNNSAAVVRIYESTGTSMAHHVWDCGLMLCYYLAHLPLKRCERFKHILELGSGTAIAGIYGAYVLQPDHIYLTDLPEALADINRNVVLQKDIVKTTVTSLEWGTHIDNIETPVDLVILADLLYNPSSHDILIKTLAQLTERNPGLMVLIGYKSRSPAEERTFFDKVRSKGWKCDQDTVTIDCSPCEIYWMSWSI